MEGIITLIIVASLFYVAPVVLQSVKTASPEIVTNPMDVNNLSFVGSGKGVMGSAALNSSQVAIGTTVAGGLNLATIGLIMLGIALMIGGLMMIRGKQ